MKYLLQFFIFITLFTFEASSQGLESLLDSALNSEQNAETIFEKAKTLVSNENELEIFLVTKHKFYGRKKQPGKNDGS